MHLKLKVGGWDYKIHWNKSSLGFGCRLKLTAGGWMYLASEPHFCETCTAPLHMSSSLSWLQSVVHFPLNLAEDLFCRPTKSPKPSAKNWQLRSVPKVQNWVAKIGSCSTMSVLCWIRKGRRLLRLDQDESFAFLRQQPGDSCSFIYLFTIDM